MSEAFQWAIIAAIAGVQLYGFFRPVADRITPDIQEPQASNPRSNQGPKIRPFGRRDRRKPKVNDEFAAWRQEQKENQNPD